MWGGVAMESVTMGHRVLWALAVVVAAMGSVVVGAGECDSLLTNPDPTCFESLSCTGPDGSAQFSIFEDCPDGTLLFTAIGPPNDITTGNCPFKINGNDIQLSRAMDAETDNEPVMNCQLFAPLKVTTVNVADVNEEKPNIIDGDPIFEVNVKEEDGPKVIASFSYADSDWKETESLKAVAQEVYGSFDLVGAYDKTNNKMDFTLSTLVSLDFEELMFYDLRYDIESTDDRGDVISTEQKVLVFVEDIGDNPPYWVRTQPSMSLDECPAETMVLKVEASDRDVTISNSIKYSIIDGNDANYFTINEISGEVETILEIDREDLDNLNFALTIQAMEYLEDGTVAPVPNSATQVSNIYIADVNDNLPAFDTTTYEIEIEELSGSDSLLDIDMFVFDMDEGSNGAFTITSDSPDDLEIKPNTGFGNFTVRIVAKWRGKDTIFDYEKQQTPLTFALTATEESDLSHIATAELTVTLKDVNDNPPVFTEPVYSLSVNETEPEGFLVVTVSATDADFTSGFGQDSIRYTTTCSQLAVDLITGEVTLTSNALNFENEEEVTCVVEARDMLGEPQGKSSTALVTITVNDVVDETPVITLPGEANVEENSPELTLVGNPVTATDMDAGADIEFSIDWEKSSATLQNFAIDVENVKEWFMVGPTTNLGNNMHSAQVSVGATKPDRETADMVMLDIRVTDVKTEAGNDYNHATFTISITDINDEAPQFNPLNVAELKENVPPGYLIMQIQATDPDEDDVITLEISSSSGDDGLVEAIEGVPGTWDLKVAPDVVIDHEKQQNIAITATITDKVKHSSQNEIVIPIKDLNDETPQMEQDKCKPIDVMEDESNGSVIHAVFATDADLFGKHGTVNYILVNDMLDDLTPFEVDRDTGEIRVLRTVTRMLDREIKDTWKLTIRANDGCEDGETDCSVNTSDVCEVDINVLDVNDESPDTLIITPDDGPWLKTSEKLKENEYIGQPYKIKAIDNDQPGTPNAIITYTVEWVRKQGDVNDLDLFEAVKITDLEEYCQLKAKQDLTRKRGDYEIFLKAVDNGVPPQQGNHTLLLKIEDANDYEPLFVFGGCLQGDPEIKMEEKHYNPGDEVLCTTNDNEGRHLDITVVDEDINLNGEFTCEIDYEKSSAIAPDGIGQKFAFKLQEISGEEKCKLTVTETIDRDKGRRYNLTLHAKDKGEPQLESRKELRIIVTSAFESPPFFNITEQTVYMIENHPQNTTFFVEAIDTDNEGYDINDPDTYQDVFYYIADRYDKDYFELLDTKKTKLKLSEKKLPDGLDRESNPEGYTLKIITSNEIYEDNIPPNLPENATLLLTIMIDDENDNGPQFLSDVSVASFTQSDKKNSSIGIIAATDADLNDKVTYTRGSFLWQNVDPPVDEPFIVNTDTGDLILNFDPVGLPDDRNGICIFNITAEDSAGHSNYTRATVYVITEKFKLPVIFDNEAKVVSNRTKEIQDIFSQVYGYSCVIDSMNEKEGKTTVYMHFIDTKNNKPVESQVIIEATSNIEVSNDLRQQLNNLELNLLRIGEMEIATGDDLSQTVLTLQVLLAVVSLVLGSLVFLVLAAYFIRTRRLELQVKVLGTNTFGSKSSDLNRIGLEMDAVPGSNLFKGEGANPMYNLTQDDLKNDDNSSISSGDSVLVGVEDNPEFKNYSSKKFNESLGGHDNQAFGRSIDQVSAPTAFTGGARSNPLWNADTEGEFDLGNGLNGFEINVRRTSSGSENSYDSGVPVNPNFSFGS